MTDEDFDRTVGDADPYRPAVVSHLDGAVPDLLEEIMSVPILERVVEPPGERPRARRSWMSGLAGSGVAAAVLAGVLVVSTINGDRPAGHQAYPVPGPSATAPSRYSAMVLQAAERNPRLLIDQPGWTATSVYGFADDTGTIAFANGDRTLEMNWYPAAQYGSYHQDRFGSGKPEPVQVDGLPADLHRYAADDFAVMLRPRGGSFVELRTKGRWNRTELDRVLAHVIQADVSSWLAALPAEIVTPGRVADRAAKVLADVPLPPGFDVATLQDLGVNDAYQFGAAVIGRVGCGWIAEWLRAKGAGDEAALARATAALRSSHHWAVLHEMNAGGDYPEAFWDLADKVVAGQASVEYRHGMGCA